MSTSGPSQLALEYLHAVRASDARAVDSLRARLADLAEHELVAAPMSQAARLAFWINLYNGTVLSQPEPRLDSWGARSAFLRRRLIVVAGHSMSLDAIEQGILRRSQFRLGLGYVQNPLASRFERRHRLRRSDPRIHFALNCATVSCPPISSYRHERIDSQLDVATRSYLASEVRMTIVGLIIPRVFLWFAGDFGGAPGIRRFLRAHGVPGAGRPIRFAPYDWTPAHGRWIDGPPTTGQARSSDQEAAIRRAPRRCPSRFRHPG